MEERELESLLKPYWDNILVLYKTAIQAKATDSSKINQSNLAITHSISLSLSGKRANSKGNNFLFMIHDIDKFRKLTVKSLSAKSSNFLKFQGRQCPLSQEWVVSGRMKDYLMLSYKKQ